MHKSRTHTALQHGIVTECSHFLPSIFGRVKVRKTMPAANFTTKRMLPVAEWMAENAYIPPGMHRLLAAGGLAVGLWGGRSLMDIVVARNHDDGSEMKRNTVPELFRPLHGIMRYNPYSDNAVDRWKSVVDKFVPAAVGGVTAYYGGRYFFHGKGFVLLDKAEKPLHGFSDAAKKALANGKVGLSSAEQLSSLAQSDTMRKFSGGMYIAGASSGTDKAGGMILGNHNAWAVSFAQGAGIKTLFPGESLPVVGRAVKYINRNVLHSMGASSVGVGRAMNKISNWAAANIHKANAEWLTEKALNDVTKDITQNFKLTGEQFNAVRERVGRFLHETHAEFSGTTDFAALAGKIQGGWGKAGFSDMGVMKLLDEAGVDLATADIGNHGLLSMYSRGMNSGKLEVASRKAYAETLKKGMDDKVFENVKATFDTNAPKLTPQQSLTLWGSVAGGLTGILGLGSLAATHINKRAKLVADDEGNRRIVTSSYAPPKEEKEPSTLLTAINGKPLDVMEWASRMVIVPPSMHRFMGAAYLSGSLYVGMKVADIMTGHKLPLLRNADLTKSILKAEEIKGIWKPLKPLHNILSYTPGSSAVADRARTAFHYLLPVTFGAYGNYLGSKHFFRDRTQKMENPKGLEDYTDKILMEQSKVFAGVTAVTSIFNTGSGIHLIPFMNYSSNLQTRYLMGAGMEVATPGLGKWWSGNAGLTPWGTKKSLTYIGNMLGNNPAQRPRELPALVHGVLAKLYPTMPETDLLLKKREFLHALHEVRDSYFVDGAVPATRLNDFKTHMKELVTGEGFEHLLLAAGFDPLQANLASNGISGGIANLMGKSNEVRTLQEEYREKFTQRLAKEKQDPRAYLHKLAKSPAEALPSANDNPLPQVAGASVQGRLSANAALPMPRALS